MVFSCKTALPTDWLMAHLDNLITDGYDPDSGLPPDP
jgi:hypothetical protein